LSFAFEGWQRIEPAELAVIRLIQRSSDEDAWNSVQWVVVLLIGDV